MSYRVETNVTGMLRLTVYGCVCGDVCETAHKSEWHMFDTYSEGLWSACQDMAGVMSDDVRAAVIGEVNETHVPRCDVCDELPDLSDGVYVCGYDRCDAYGEEVK